MNAEQARALFLEHCQPSDRGTLERYGEKAAVAAIMAVTAFIEAEARRYSGFYQPHSDGWNTFVIFADMMADLTADRLARASDILAAAPGEVR
jgi:hypothetical protein